MTVKHSLVHSLEEVLADKDKEIKRLQHYPQAIATVRSWYPEDVFPDTQAAARMARLTCDNIEREVALETPETEVEEVMEQTEVERLQAFLHKRVLCGLLKKHGGYHGRRIHMEAEKLLADPTYFPGKLAAETKED